MRIQMVARAAALLVASMGVGAGLAGAGRQPAGGLPARHLYDFALPSPAAAEAGAIRVVRVVVSGAGREGGFEGTAFEVAAPARAR